MSREVTFANVLASMGSVDFLDIAPARGGTITSESHPKITGPIGNIVRVKTRQVYHLRLKDVVDSNPFNLNE